MKHMVKFHVKLRLRIIKHMELLQIYCSILELARLPVLLLYIIVILSYNTLTFTKCMIRFDHNIIMPVYSSCNNIDLAMF